MSALTDRAREWADEIDSEYGGVTPADADFLRELADEADRGNGSAFLKNLAEAALNREQHARLAAEATIVQLREALKKIPFEGLGEGRKIVRAALAPHVAFDREPSEVHIKRGQEIDAALAGVPSTPPDQAGEPWVEAFGGSKEQLVARLEGMGVRMSAFDEDEDEDLGDAGDARVQATDQGTAAEIADMQHRLEGLESVQRCNDPDTNGDGMRLCDLWPDHEGPHANAEGFEWKRRSGTPSAERSPDSGSSLAAVSVPPEAEGL